MLLRGTRLWSPLHLQKDQSCISLHTSPAPRTTPASPQTWQTKVKALKESQSLDLGDSSALCTAHSILGSETGQKSHLRHQQVGHLLHIFLKTNPRYLAWCVIKNLTSCVKLLFFFFWSAAQLIPQMITEALRQPEITLYTCYCWRNNTLSCLMGGGVIASVSSLSAGEQGSCCPCCFPL